MAETNLWQWLKGYCPRGKFLRVENGDCDPGTPDVHYRIPKKSGWIELKDARHPKSKVPFPNQKFGVRQSQIDWITEYVSYGGLVWIAARVGREIFFIHGIHVKAINGASIRRLRFMASLIIDQDGAFDLKKFKSILEGNQ